MLPSLLLAVFAGLGFIPIALADTYCSADVPCDIGCCGKYNVCGMGPTYCGPGNCINNCDAKAECNPGSWPSEYVNTTSCPLNVCCSDYGFCGTTEEFCGNSTVTRPSCDKSSQSITRVIGYYNSAANSRSCDGMAPYSIPQGVYSHLYFAFGSIDPDTFEVVPASSGDKLLYPQLAALNGRDLGQELWLSIGGWDFSDDDAATATTFSDLCAADKSTQNTFFNSLILFMNTYGFSGVDIDWEYPAADDRNGRAEDYDNFPKFLASLKKALDEYKFGLSITLPTSYWYLQHFDVVSIEPSVDWFNFMSYDLHGTWDEGDEWTGAFLDAHTNLTEIETALDLLWRNNITSSKVNMGLAFYGRSFTLASSSCIEPGCAYLSAGDAGNCSITAGILFNSEINQLISDNDLTPTLYKDAAVKAINWNDDQWVSYDDQDTWKIKADFAKSQCLGGVLVWSVDNDDRNQTFSDGLAAALGNTINVDPTTGLTGGLFEQLSTDTTTTTTTVKSSEKYCHFINCGEVCQSGYTDVVRADAPKQLMLDSTKCDSQTQTLCCPTSGDVPTCQWRGFHNNGKCKGGCNDDEAEVGTVGAGCTKSGYQSACCTITNSTVPWSKCAWTSTCESDKTCPSGYSNFLVSSRSGSGGQTTCKDGKTYSYCCSGSAVPDAFTNCAWNAKPINDISDDYCTDTCPSGTMRIAAESLNTIFTNGKNTGHVSGCYMGYDGYCCAGANQTVTTRSGTNGTTGSNTTSAIGYQDQTAKDFDTYLQAFLSDPACPDTWDAEYSASFDLASRDVSGSQTTASSNLNLLLPMMVTLFTSQYQRTDELDILNTRLSENGLGDAATNLTTSIRGLFYEGNWTGTPDYDATALMSQVLCDIASSTYAVQSLEIASEILCELPSDSSSSSLARRMLDGTSMNSRSDNKDQPTVLAALQGVLSGDLSLHYARWLQSRRPGQTQINQVILELAFWIGSTPGVTPDSDVLAQYSDSTHTVETDRWVVFHMHIPLTSETFLDRGADQEYLFPRVSALGVYHSQTLYEFNVVTHGTTTEPRAEFRLGSTYRDGTYNTGSMQDYNARTQILRCPVNHRWTVGNDMQNTLDGLSNTGSPTEYAETLNSFGSRLVQMGVFANQNMARIWPAAADLTGGDGFKNSKKTNIRGDSDYNPASDAFETNFLGNGESVDISGSAPTTP